MPYKFNNQQKRRQEQRRQREIEDEIALNEYRRFNAKDTKALETSSSQNTLFVCVGLFVSFIPFLTYAIPIVEAGALLDSSMSIYLLNILVSGFILAATYLQNCKQHLSIYSTLLKDGPDHVDSQVAATDRGKILLEQYEAFRASAEQTAHRKAVNFSFFSVNLTFMLSYLAVSFLFHEALSEVSDVWKFVLACDLSALSALALGSSGFYKFLSENSKLI